MSTITERRGEPRQIADIPVLVTVLGIEEQPIRGRIVDISGRGVLVEMISPVACGLPVRVEGEDSLMLGEVCRCEAQGKRFRVALQVRHRLNALRTLERLNRILLGEIRRPATVCPHRF